MLCVGHKIMPLFANMASGAILSRNVFLKTVPLVNLMAIIFVCLHGRLVT